MALGGKMDDGRRTVRAQQTGHQFPVGYVALHQHMARIMIQGSKVFGIAAVGQLVQVDDRDAGGTGPQNETGTDEAATTGDQIQSLHDKRSPSSPFPPEMRLLQPGQPGWLDASAGFRTSQSCGTMPHHPAPQSLPLPRRPVPAVQGVPQGQRCAARGTCSRGSGRGVPPPWHPAAAAARHNGGAAVPPVSPPAGCAAPSAPWSPATGPSGAACPCHVSFTGHEPFQADMTQAGDIQDDFHIGTIDAPLVTPQRPLADTELPGKSFL